MTASNNMFFSDAHVEDIDKLVFWDDRARKQARKGLIAADRGDFEEVARLLQSAKTCERAGQCIRDGKRPMARRTPEGFIPPPWKRKNAAS